MKLKFIRESIIINEKSSDYSGQPSEKAIKGFRLNILDYIKREFVNAVKKKGLLCVLDEKTKPLTLNIQYPKDMDILEPETIEVTDEIIRNGLDVDNIVENIKMSAEAQLKTTLDKTKLSEAIINEGPIANLFAKMVAKRQIKKEIKAENKEIKDAVAELNGLNPHEIVLENNKIVRISINAKYNKTDIDISCRLYEDLSIITAQLIETDRGYYIDEVEDFFGNKMDNLNSDLPIEDALQRIAEKIGVQIPEPKFNTITGRPDENTLQKRIKDDKILINLYNNDYINTNKSREIAKLLSNIKEDLNNPNDFAAYKKALSMATDKNGKYSPYTIGLIIQYMIKKEFQNCAEELRDTNTLRKFQKFIEKHLELDDIRDKLVTLKKDGNLKKFFGHKLEVVPLANCKVVTNTDYYEVGDTIELTVTPDEGFVFEKTPAIKDASGIKILSIDKNDEDNSYNITFIVHKVLENDLEILGKLVGKKDEKEKTKNTTVDVNNKEVVNKEDVKDEAPKKKNVKMSAKKVPTTPKTPVKKDYNKMLKDLRGLGLRIDTTKLFTRDEAGNINGVTPLFKQLKKTLRG